MWVTRGKNPSIKLLSIPSTHLPAGSGIQGCCAAPRTWEGEVGMGKGYYSLSILPQMNQAERAAATAAQVFDGIRTPG